MKKTINLSSIQLRKLHQVDLEILLEFDRICRKYKIKYSLDGGTLLGAVREKGFIPWDDDVDVVVSRKEYNKFFKVCQQDLDRSRFFLQNYRTDKNYIFGYAKLRRKETVFKRVGQDHLKQKGGIFIDIFIRDNVPDSFPLRQVHCFVCYILKTILNSELNKVNGRNFLIRYWNKLLNLVPSRTAFCILGKIADFSNRKETRLWRTYTFSMPHSEYGFPKEICQEFIEIEFEKHQFMAYKRSQEYLTILYGPNFMQRPPVEEQVGHNYVNEINFGHACDR
ncbi:MAG: LicD family protein [Liquorilactobacillus nagelii]|jgi:lipopolysaccharide cholinephosphotransferase|uniref:LicD/FKTN/FKRP nucleotidyltransferase domain-containing protein n=1 Tax=Liquorilactobacillus nagelii TaxID=82688 RepID=A0A3S6QXW9_9LACO|nr:MULTISPECIES: LicD family protein [Lactobacillales]AUJ33012.1 hypothetical protein BSQ50_10935 [Liquorilactobacillus nagelii]KRL42111.1 lipopolysaccharide cholinephosphotransferase [Liquorilactobacillus nagelii DSM 13675]MCC7616618.1 lipopolysaccharide cholinephosphotransferase [Liquorilactobacillus nagelii]MCI1700046.1 LicD family protein [Liquorilactobacillus nagelii]MCI1820215.1 LicD family protein [Carnobacterium maltaromaticum]